MQRCKTALILFAMATSAWAEPRVNHEGRVLPERPAILEPVLFNTPEADAILAAMQIFPLDNPWNEDISRRPLLANSDAMISQITSDLASNRRNLRAFFEMNFVLVPDDQAKVPVNFFNYPDESDPSPYPFPANLPVETWPRETGALSLTEWQRDVNGEGGDRHAIAVMPGARLVWETWLNRRTDAGWEASNGAKFDLNSNQLRPAGWTSGDAAGLPMFPALVRYDECQRGMVEHALRLVVKRTRVEPIYPATHSASVGNLKDPNIPAMGQRLRLKASFAIPESWSKPEQAVLKALKKYGAIVADNGNFFSVSVTPDHRWTANEFGHLSTIAISNFEVIQTTGPNEGPRAPGAPRVSAGPDRNATMNETIQLQGSVQYTNTAPLKTAWTLYSGPAPVVFGDALATNSPVTFSVPGEYLIVLSANDGLHTPAYSALTVTVSESASAPRIAAAWIGGSVQLNWSWPGPVALEAAGDVDSANWQQMTNLYGTVFSVHPVSSRGFYRLRAL